MCTEILVIKGNERIICDTVGQLARALQLKPAEVSHIAGENNCLCNARFKALGAREATQEEGWPWPEFIVDHSKLGEMP